MNKLGSPETMARAGLGMIGGVAKYYIRPELTAKRAWAVLGAGVIAYELACDKGELLSEGADRAIDKHPIITKLAIGVTALHLANAFESLGIGNLDPFGQAIKRIKGL